MKKLMIVAAAAALFAGCQKEAERFGYKGADLQDDDKMFFTTGPGVTNWVPARVLSVCEAYPVSAEETALVAAAGVITPSESFEKVPDGYAKSVEEPWFVTWTKEAENFGRKGVNGFISHFNEDKKVWETSETYFSSYHKDEASALAALADLRKTVGEKFSPKRFHDFDRCWVAEYLRLRVMCLVGQKGDGTWSCMLDIQDKNRPGCGQWEPVPAQEERLAEYTYRKAFAAWKEAKKRTLDENHAVVEKLREKRGVPLFGEGARAFESEDGRLATLATGVFAADATSDRAAIWGERVKAVEEATGVKISDEPAVQELPSGYVVWGAGASDEIYEVRIDVAFPPPAAAGEEAAEGEGAPETEPASGEWRALCFERLQPGFALPPRPQPPKFDR